MALGEVDDADFQAWADRVKGKIDSGTVKREIGNSAKRIGVQALRQFKANTPVDTGGLRGAWIVEGPNYDGGGWIVELQNNKNYASYVEQGHRQTPGRYVPAFGKRLKASWVEGQFFMQKSEQQINAQLPALITPGLKAFEDLLN